MWPFCKLKRQGHTAKDTQCLGRGCDETILLLQVRQRMQQGCQAVMTNTCRSTECCSLQSAPSPPGRPQTTLPFLQMWVPALLFMICCTPLDTCVSGVCITLFHACCCCINIETCLYMLWREYDVGEPGSAALSSPYRPGRRILLSSFQALQHANQRHPSAAGGPGVCPDFGVRL